MKSVVFILAMLFAGQSFAVDLLYPGTIANPDGKPGLFFEKEMGGWFRYGTNIWLGSTEFKACKNLNKQVDPNATGVEFVNMQSGLTEENGWVEHQSYADLYPLHTVSCYIPDQDQKTDDKWSPERCWLPSTNPLDPVRILTTSDMEQHVNAAWGDMWSSNNTGLPWAYHDPQPVDSGTYVTAAQFHGDTGEFIYGTCAPAIFNTRRDDDGGWRSGEVISGYHTHKYCPPGTRLMYEYGHPDGQWGGYYCGEGRVYTGTLEFKQIPELLYDNCKHTATSGGTITIEAPWKPECDGTNCPNVNMYFFADFTGEVPGKEGLPDGWADSQIQVFGEYDQERGKKIWSVDVSKLSLDPNDGVIDAATPKGMMTFMFMQGNGKRYPENPQNGQIGNCVNFNEL